MIEQQQDDLAQLTDLANQELSKRTVRWRCIFCYHEVPHEWSEHCGEQGRTEPIPSEEIDDYE